MLNGFCRLSCWKISYVHFPACGLATKFGGQGCRLKVVKGYDCCVPFAVLKE